jgi:beta-xylosidase
MDLTTGDSLSEPELFYVSPLPIDTPRLAEGSHFYFVDGYYYLFTAEGGTNNAHREMVSRSKSMDGPWEPHPQNPILYNG